MEANLAKEEVVITTTIKGYTEGVISRAQATVGTQLEVVMATTKDTETDTTCKDRNSRVEIMEISNNMDTINDITRTRRLQDTTQGVKDITISSTIITHRITPRTHWENSPRSTDWK